MSVTYSIDKGSSGACNVEQAVAVAAVEELAPGERVTIENTTVEHEYDVFYGGGPDVDRHLSEPSAFSQHRVTKATDHRQAAINSLYCNYGDGTRYLVVGPEPKKWGSGTEKTGRIFEVNHCKEGDPRIVHTYTHTYEPFNDWLYGYGWPHRNKSYTLPTQYYRVDEVGRRA